MAEESRPVFKTEDVNIAGTQPLISPAEMKRVVPATPAAEENVLKGRAALRAILDGSDSRLLLVVGPCSIHDETAALDYAQKLRSLANMVRDRILLVMRVYFEKPRTTIGWKGLINDPNLDGSFDIARGLERARRLLLTINEAGLLAGSEMLDPISPQYIASLIAWASIGARTTESQTHRLMASGLSMPVGYKNGTDGSLQTAVDAMSAAQHPHSFLGIDNDGRTCVLSTRGNPWGHLILRGGHGGPNFDPDSVALALEKLRGARLPEKILIDCSHANCGKDYTRQHIVFQSALRQRLEGNAAIIGMMLESNLHEGRQELTGNPRDLKYGVSVTDPCIGWEETLELVLEAHRSLPPAG